MILLKMELYFFSGCFYYLASTINPILYNVMSARYREAFLQTLCTLPGGAGNQFANRFNYQASSSSMRNHLNSRWNRLNTVSVGRNFIGLFWWLGYFSSRGGSSRPGGSGCTATSTLSNNRISERRTISSLLPHNQNSNGVQSVAVRIVEDPAAEQRQQQQQQQQQQEGEEMRLLGCSTNNSDSKRTANGSLGSSPRCLVLSAGGAGGEGLKQQQQQQEPLGPQAETGALGAVQQDIDPIVTAASPPPSVTEWRNAPVHLLLVSSNQLETSITLRHVLA